MKNFNRSKYRNCNYQNLLTSLKLSITNDCLFHIVKLKLREKRSDFSFYTCLNKFL